MHEPKQLLQAKEYVRDATKHIATATRRVSLLATIVVDDQATRALVDALCAAAERGIAVNVAVDFFTYTELGGHFTFHTFRSKKLEVISRLRHRLKASGATFRWLGRYSNTLLNGRTHSKWLIVDDCVYTFGGVNLYRAGIDSTDYMFRSTDPTLATHLVREQQRITEADRHHYTHWSYTFPSGHDRVLIDGGIIGDSIIYRRACQLAARASTIIYVSQYCPTGKLSRLLKKTHATLYFNHWDKASSLNALAIRAGLFMSGQTTHYNRRPYLHAKFILFTLPDGTKIALTGSHNFSNAGVWLGTREIALETQDGAVIEQLETFVKQHVA